MCPVYVYKCIVITLFTIFLTACGTGQLTVDYIEVPSQVELLELSGGTDTLGFATWEDTIDGRYCIIYMMPESMYYNEDQYLYIAGHEFKRHCVEGLIHKKTTYLYPYRVKDTVTLNMDNYLWWIGQDTLNPVKE